MIKKINIFSLVVLAILFSWNNSFAMTGTIDAVDKYAWSENIGWINFGCDTCNVQVTDTQITGYAWSDNYGWLNLEPSVSGITNTNGVLSGNAWGENIGWIDFSGVTIDSNGEFQGYADGTETGKISFNCANTNTCSSSDFKLKTTWLPPTCDDGVQNQDETGIDVGGVCNSEEGVCTNSYASSFFASLNFFKSTSSLSALESILRGYFYYDCQSRTYYHGGETAALEDAPEVLEQRKTTTEINQINTNQSAENRHNYYNQETRVFQQGRIDGSLEEISESARIIPTTSITSKSDAEEGVFYFDSTTLKFYRGNAEGTLDALFVKE